MIRKFRTILMMAIIFFISTLNVAGSQETTLVAPLTSAIYGLGTYTSFGNLGITNGVSFYIDAAGGTRPYNYTVKLRISTGYDETLYTSEANYESSGYKMLEAPLIGNSHYKLDCIAIDQNDIYATAISLMYISSDGVKTILIETPLEEVWSEWQQVRPSTCTEEGYDGIISNYGNSSTRWYPALGHDWSAWVLKTPATCTTKGVEERICARDATHMEARDVAALGHDWGEWETKIPATCIETGLEERVCKNDATHIETREIAALDHDWGEWMPSESGFEKRVCSNDETHTESRQIVLPGDTNGDSTIDILDLVSIIDYIVSNTSPASQANADANGDGTVDILDLVWIIDQIVGG